MPVTPRSPQPDQGPNPAQTPRGHENGPPAGPDGAAAETPGRHAERHQRQGPAPRPSPDRTVLLVEDDDIAGEALRAGLSGLAMSCTWVRTVDEARRLLAERTFDAVVTDIMLGADAPSGLDLVKELEPSGAPVLVITAFADLTRVKEALNHGAAYLLEKPFRAEDLGRALASVWEEPRGLGHFVERALERAQLTAKEREVARLLLKGLSTKEMAGVTGNTEKTLKHHIAAIFQKFEVTSRAELFHCIFPT